MGSPPFGLGYDPSELPKVIGLRHPHESVERVAARMADMRAAVERLLKEEIEPLLEVGRPVNRNDGATIINETANTSTRVVARLKRDDPAMAARVVAGEITANAAAREKG